MPSLLCQMALTNAVYSVNTESLPVRANCDVGRQTSTGETAFKSIWRVAGVLSKFYIKVRLNTQDNNAVFRVRKNAGNGTQTFTVLAGATGEHEDASGTDTVADGDEFTILKESQAGSGSITATPVSLLFTPTSGTAFHMGNAERSGKSNNNTTLYFGVAGGTSVAPTTESTRYMTVRAACTLSKLQVNIFANARTTTTTVKTRKNTADGGQSVSIATTLTGEFEDASGTDAVADGDEIAFAAVMGASAESIEFTLMSVLATFTTAGQFEIATGNRQSIAAGTTEYAPFAGQLSTLSTTETHVQGAARMAMTVDKLRVNVTSNGISATSTLQLRVNAGNGTSAASITASTSGIFEDASGSDALIATDQVNYAFVPGGTGTTALFEGSMLRAQAPAAAGNSGRLLPLMGGG